jgi:hypothetical protein
VCANNQSSGNVCQAKTVVITCDVTLCSILLYLSQITCYSDSFRYIYFVIHLDIRTEDYEIMVRNTNDVRMNGDQHRLQII